MFIILHNQPDPEDVHQHNCHIEDYLPAPQLRFLQPPVEKHLHHRKRNKISLPLILNYRFLDKPSVAMEIAGSNLNQMKGSIRKGKGESLWPLTSHLSHIFYTGVYKILFNLQYWLVSFPSVLYAGEYVIFCLLGFANPSTPMSDQDRISPYNIFTISCWQVMRIKKNINLGIIIWSNTKFSVLTL